MGACFSCCGDEEKKGSGYSSMTPPAEVLTEKDREARARAAEAAASRQSQFESSAVGRAAYKSVKEVKEERRAGPPAAANGVPDARDWQN